MHFDINMQEDTNGVFAVDDQIKTTTQLFAETAPENADWLSSREDKGSVKKGLKRKADQMSTDAHTRQYTEHLLLT